jgi:hypothetical protein
LAELAQVKHLFHNVPIASSPGAAQTKLFYFASCNDDNKERLVAAMISAYLKDNQFRQVEYDVLIFSSPENFILASKKQR